jgi:hypothetical protein
MIILNREYRALWSIVFRSYLRTRLTASYIIYELSYLVCKIYGSDRRDLRDREEGGEVEDGEEGEDHREGQRGLRGGKRSIYGGNKG